jgi:hypothetical protein
MDFDCYWVVGWAVRDRNPLKIYSALSTPDSQGRVAISNSMPEWVALNRVHLPAGHYTAPYNYPPHLAVFFQPLTYLPYRLAPKVWRLIGLSAYLICIGLLLSLVREPASRNRSAERAAIAALFLVLSAPALYLCLWLGQIQPLISLSVIASYYCVQKGRPIAAGICLAFGILIKLYPVVFLVWFLMRRRWATAAACVASLIALTIAALGAVGVAPFTRYFTACLPLISHGTPFYNNISIVSIGAWIFHLGSPYRDITLPSDPRLTALKLLFYAAILTIAIKAALAGTSARKSPSLERSNAEFVLINFSLLLLSPITWSHHFIDGLLALLLILPLLLDRSQSLATLRRSSMRVTTAIGIGYVLLLQAPDLHGSLLYHLWYGTVTSLIGVLILWAVSCWWISSPSSPVNHQPPPAHLPP